MEKTNKPSNMNVKNLIFNLLMKYDYLKKYTLVMTGADYYLYCYYDTYSCFWIRYHIYPVVSSSVTSDVCCLIATSGTYHSKNLWQYTWLFSEQHDRDNNDDQQDDESNSHRYENDLPFCQTAHIEVFLLLVSWVWMTVRLWRGAGGTQQHTRQLITHLSMQSYEQKL